jgi:triacylglycerol lipase
MSKVPVILVHGIWDTAERIEPLRSGLVLRGIQQVVAIDLQPNNGRAPIPNLAEQVREAVNQLGPSDAQVDLVGFSMGALVSRYYLQRLGGTRRVRRFVSISGPHAGTLTAYGMPFEGVRQMRPASPLLADLAADTHPWGPTEVHTVRTPYDLMIVPSSSSELPGSTSQAQFPVKMHRFMIRDARVLDHVARVLGR